MNNRLPTPQEYLKGLSKASLAKQPNVMEGKMTSEQILREFAYLVLSDSTHMSKDHVLERLYELAESAEKAQGLDMQNRVASLNHFLELIQ